jgi:hypothetical protein
MHNDPPRLDDEYAADFTSAAWMQESYLSWL